MEMASREDLVSADGLPDLASPIDLGIINSSLHDVV